MSQEQDIWRAVQAILSDELAFRANSKVLRIEPDRLDDFADHLADVVVANFELTRRRDARD